MPEPFTAATLAAAAVHLLSPYLTEAAKAGAGESGKALAKSLGGPIAALFDKVRTGLARRGEVRALERYEAAPTDVARRGGLEYALEGVLDTDPVLRAEIERLVVEGGTRLETGPQHMTIEGDGNAAAQVAGANNQVHIQSADG